MDNILTSHYEEIYGLINWIYKAYTQDVNAVEIFKKFWLFLKQ